MTVKTTQYADVRLTAATYDSATVTHSTGVAKIPIAQLTTPQIASLNATSGEVQAGTAELQDDLNSRAQHPFTRKLRVVGTRTTEFVALRLGLGRDLLTIWLLFLIFPALIVLLLIGNIIQARKVRTIRIPPARR